MDEDAVFSDCFDDQSSPSTTPSPENAVSANEFQRSVREKKGFRFMKQIRKRWLPPEHFEDSLERIASESQLKAAFTDRQLQGLMMMYHYIHPDDEPYIHKKCKVIDVLNSFRKLILWRTPLSAHQYLLDAFDEAASSVQLRQSLGEDRLVGAMSVFSYLCPSEECDDLEAALSSLAEDVQADGGATSTSTATTAAASAGGSSSAAASATERTRGPLSVGLRLGGADGSPPTRAFIMYYGDRPILIFTS